MVYITNAFRKKFAELSGEFQNSVFLIVKNINQFSSKELPIYLDSLYLSKEGRSKFTGISKTLFHLYSQGKSSEHRILYCYASDLDNDELIEKTNLLAEDVIFIDYTTNHRDTDFAARRYNKSTINSLYSFSQSNNSDILKDGVGTKIPNFFFKLTEDQQNILTIEQPASIKGSAGTGKTLISFELFKQWIMDDSEAKLLYLTYTEKLLKSVKDNLILDGVDISRKNIDIFEFKDLLSETNDFKIINEISAREIIRDILKEFLSHNPKLYEDNIFTDYFVYSYIRGLIKGRINHTNKSKRDYELKYSALDEYIKNLNLGMDTTKTRDVIKGHLENNYLTLEDYRKSIIPTIVKRSNKKNLKDNLFIIFNEKAVDDINKFREEVIIYSFIEKDDVIKELIKDQLNTVQIKGLLSVADSYNKKLSEKRFKDDNDYALYLLNSKLNESDKYDGIIIDEIQDLTETQVMSISKFLKSSSNKISFFGDPNQTINPTVYHYGRFNSYIWNKNTKVNLRNLKKTHRCGRNLLEYINHLVDLRKKLNLTTNTEDLEKEVSARQSFDDGHFACLIEDKNVINHIFEVLTDALDFYIIVDNEETKEDVIKQIDLIQGEEIRKQFDEKIITVQNSKGLECSNVIMYNLISDNLNIFENLINEKNKVASMTFNKFYVSLTRARNSVIICETRLEKHSNVREVLFYVGGTKIPEEIKEEDVSDYLELTTNPEPFYYQAIDSLEAKEYEKAFRKSNIALRHLFNQFEFDTEIEGKLPQIILDNLYYKELIEIKFDLREANLEKYETAYKALVDNLKTSNRNDDDIFKLLIERYDMLVELLRIRKIFITITEYNEKKDIIEDFDKLDYHERFLLLGEYNMTIEIVNTLNENREDYLNLVNYYFGNTTFEKIRESFNKVLYLNEEIPRKIVDQELEVNFKNSLINKIEKLRGLF